MILPRLALSVRQPWAWAIIHGKDIENRSWNNFSPAYKDAKRVKAFAVHAAQGMTRYEYDDAAELITKILGHCPPAHELVRGGIIGSVELTGIVRESKSPWFFGTIGLVLANPVECGPPIRATGQLGFFEWKENAEPWPDPAKWMRPPSERTAQAELLANLAGTDLHGGILPPGPEFGGINRETTSWWSAPKDVTDWKPDPTAGSVTHEDAGTAYDPGAAGHELQGRKERK